MDGNVDHTDVPLYLETPDNDDENMTTTLLPLGAISTWTKTTVSRVSLLSVLMLATLICNIILIVLILSSAELRNKRVNIFMLNIAVSDLLVGCFTMTTEILFVAFGRWVLGAFACKLTVYGQIFTLASTTFLLTTLSIDTYKVRVIIDILEYMQ